MLLCVCHSLKENMVKIFKFAQVWFYLEMFLNLNFGLCHVLRTGFVLNFYSEKMIPIQFGEKCHFTALRVETIWRLELK